MVKNGIKIPGLERAFGRLTESTEGRERPLGLRNRRHFLFFFFDSNQTSNALTNQNWQEIENCPTMDGELVCPIMAGVPVCLSCWQNIQCLPGKFATLHTLKSVVVSTKTDFQSKMVFLRSSNISEVVS